MNDDPIAPNRRGVLIAAATLPVCLVLLLATSRGAREAPCADARPEDVGRELPEQLAPLVPADAPYCAMTAGLTRIDLPAGDAALPEHLASLDARMRGAGWARCASAAAPDEVGPEQASRCFTRGAQRLELTAHLAASPAAALVLHATLAQAGASPSPTNRATRKPVSPTSSTSQP